MATACRRHYLCKPERVTTQGRSVQVSDEPLVLPAQVEYRPGKFKPVLSCSHDELIDAAMQYMTRAHEYRQLAEGLSKLASGSPPEQRDEPPAPAVQSVSLRHAGPASDPQPVKRLHLVRSDNPTENPA
jgi:hypothetical protein